MSLPGVLGRAAGRAALPAFLVVLLVLGGASREAFYADAALQIVSAGVLAWCLIDPRLNRLTRSAWIMLCFAALLAAAVLLQLIPLPPDIWSRLPGRQIVVEGFAAMGEALPWMPMTLAPEETVFGLLKFLPALAAFVLAAKLTPHASASPLSWTIALFAVATVALGLGQIFDGRESALYFHANTNWGSPVGFMANVNHQATFLLMALPFGAVVISRGVIDAQLGNRDPGLGFIVFVLLAVVVLGIMIAGSTAGYGLLVPAVLLSVLIGRGRGGGPVTIVAVVGVAFVVAILGIIVASSPRLVGLGVTDLSNTSLGRPDTYARTLQAIGETMPIGSGLGSFEGLFPGYEDPSQVTSTFMNHAHNDYLEFVLEFGAAGMALIAAFLIWFVWRCVSIWRADGEDGSRLRKAASIAVLIVLLHSIVDYPARTAAISGFAGLCLGVMAAGSQPQRKRRRAQPVTEVATHVTI